MKVNACESGWMCESEEVDRLVASISMPEQECNWSDISALSINKEVSRDFAFDNF